METLTKFSHHGGIRERIRNGYFKMDNKVDLSLCLFVTRELCVDILQIPLKTIVNGINENRGGKRKKCWISFCDGFNVWIRYDSIPIKTKNKKNIPYDSKSMYERLRSISVAKEEFFKNEEFVVLHSVMESTYNDLFPHYLKYYKDKFKALEKQILYAKTHAIFERIFKLLAEKFPPEAIFSAYKSIAYNELSSGRLVIFHTENQRSFWRKIKSSKEVGVAATLIHGNRGLTQPNRIKLTEPIKAFIRVLLRRNERFTYRKIVKRVKSKFNVSIDISSIKKYVATNKEVSNLTKYDSSGLQYSRVNSLPKLSRVLAENPGDVFQGDYYTLQFIYRTDSGNISRMISYNVLDVFSKKIVGWSLGEDISELLPVEAFKMAFTSCGFLPSEIMIDNDAFYKRQRFQQFILATQSVGVVWNIGQPGMPTVRSEIESFFSKFQKQICSDRKFYIGEGVKSRNKTGNPSEALIKKYWLMKGELPSKEEMKQEYAKMIHDYNYSTYEYELTT